MISPQGLLDTSLILKLVILIFIWYTYEYAKKRGIINFPRFFPVLIITLACRDIIYHLFTLFEALILSDIFIMIWYTALVRSFTGKKPRDKWFFISNILFILFILSNSLFAFVPRDIFGLYRGDITIIYRLLFFIFITYLSVQFFSVSRYNTVDYKILEHTRYLFTLFVVIYNLFMVLFPYYHFVIHTFVIPLSYFIHLFVLSRYIDRFDDILTNERNFLENNFESLFEFLRKITSALSDKIDLTTILSHIVHSAVKSTNADAGAILLLNEYEKKLTVEALDGIFPPPYPTPEIVKRKISSINDYFLSTPIYMGKTVLGISAATAEPIFIKNTAEDDRMLQNTQNDVFFISSIIVIPLTIKGKILGVLAIIKKHKNIFFTDIDFNHIKTFANYTSLTIENLITYMEVLDKRDIEKEVGIAATIQKRLLPQNFPNKNALSFSAFSIPAKGVGGDYYDVISISKTKTALVMCDVSGKGIPAALIMVMIRTIVHLIADRVQSASAALEWINKGISNQISVEHFATLTFLTYDSVEGILEYASAGHLPVLYCRGESPSCVELDTGGIPLGIDSAATYTSKTLRLKPSDSIVLYTDGVTEAESGDGELFGKEKLIRLLEEKVNLFTTEEITELVRKTLSDFTGDAEISDDQTFCIMKRQV